jgi:alpha-galactosidase
VSQQYARVGRKHWYPRNSLSARLPVEWNHWWPYEDAEINQAVFTKNVIEAEKMGFEVCTLDAGWFGPADAGTFWEHYRGDWHLVNDQRFPDGIRSLAEQVHARNMKFGIWCEIEGLGISAQVAIDHPDYVAKRDDQRLGYVCFGNPNVQDWAYATLTRLINEYQADWIKVDFNLDPGAGCSRSDHGHQAGDGLYEHYQGYYRTLERVRRDYPQVVLENCSSGGLRIDLGMLRRTDMTFLSDPDWPEHDLQIFWGASTMLAPDALLHWTFSDWRNLNPPRQQNFNPHDPNLTQKKWDYYSRISMLGLYGLSQKLPDLPAWLAKRMAEHTSIYKNHVRRFIKEADLYRLTDQPRRSGEGERWPAFQYSLPDGSEHVLFVFRLPGGEAQRAIRMQGLLPDRMYQIEGFEGELSQQMLGRVLMEDGLLFSNLEVEDSLLLKIA